MLKKYIPFLRVHLMRMLAYRAAIVSWFFVDLFYMVMMIFLWQSIYKNETNINGFTFENIVIYFLVIGLLSVFVQVEAMFTVSEELRQGQISMYLIKPINYKVRVFFEEIGRRIGIASIMVPINIVVLIIASYIFDINLSLSVGQIIVFLIFIPLNFLLMYEFSYMFGLFSIYTTNVFGLAILAGIIISVTSGQLVPLDFYPEFIRNIINILPFQFVNYYPPMVLMGKFTYLDAFSGMGLLIVWIVILKTINYFLFRLNEKKIVIFGG